MAAGSLHNLNDKISNAQEKKKKKLSLYLLSSLLLYYHKTVCSEVSGVGRLRRAQCEHLSSLKG